MKNLIANQIIMISGGVDGNPIFQCSCEGYDKANYDHNGMTAYIHDENEIIPLIMTRFNMAHLLGSSDVTMEVAEMHCIKRCESLDMSMSSCILVGFM